MKAILARKLDRLVFLLFRILWRVRLSVFKNPVCRSCGGSTIVRSGYGRKFLECSSCGLIFSDDYPEILARSGMGMEGSWGGADSGGEREDFLVRMLVENLGVKTSLLYGVGSTLAFPVLRSENFDVYGCDLSSDVINYRQREYGTDRFFHVNDIENMRGVYDAVIACEVFEHFHDPAKWVGMIVRSLSAGGIVCGTTNFYPGGTIEDGQKIGYMSLREHVVYWSEDSMGKLMKKFGMSLITFEMVCPGSVKPDKKFNDLFPNKRVFFASSDQRKIEQLQQLKAGAPILPLDTSDYPHPAYRQVAE